MCECSILHVSVPPPDQSISSDKLLSVAQVVSDEEPDSPVAAVREGFENAGQLLSD